MKIYKKIVSIFLIFTLVVSNFGAGYADEKEVSFVEEVELNTTRQLKIPAGASEQEWTTSSKRIATVNKYGQVVGVKIGECIVTCKATYPKFIFFKDIVNYIFNINVIKGNDNINKIVNEEIDDDKCCVNYILFIDDFVKGANQYSTQIIEKGFSIEEPPIPISDLAIFNGWYSDPDGDEKYDFDSKIYDNLTLYAYWEIDEKDSDSDNLIDIAEINIYKTDPFSKDTDNDRLSDYEEISIGTNPLKFSTNGNGKSDYDWDMDEDGLVNGEELLYNTNPNISDSDADGINDCKEVRNYKTNPLLKDTDADGANDKWELNNGFDPLVFNETFEIRYKYDEINDDNPVSIEVLLNADGKSAESLLVKQIGVIDTYLASSNVSGYMGRAYDISSDDGFNNANLIFNYDVSRFGNIGKDFEPRIYYINEQNGTYEELPNQIIENGKISASIEHFSKYILLNKIAFEKVWKSDIKPAFENIQKMEGIDMAIALDTSGSMEDNDPNNLRIEVGKKIISSLTDRDRASIVDFDDSSKVLSSMTYDKNVLKQSLKKLILKGEQALRKV